VTTDEIDKAVLSEFSFQDVEAATEHAGHVAATMYALAYHLGQWQAGDDMKTAADDIQRKARFLRLSTTLPISFAPITPICRTASCESQGAAFAPHTPTWQRIGLTVKNRRLKAAA